MKNLTVFLCLLAAHAAAVVTPDPIMPAERQTTWQGNVGRPGGIPFYPVGINVKNPPYNAYGDGFHNDTAAIQGAINAAANSTAVYLPTGTYLITNTLLIPSGYMTYPSIALRGDGPGLTTIEWSNATGVTSYSDVILIQHGTQLGGEIPIVGGLSQGSQSITLSNAAGVKVGSFLSITELNDTNFVSIFDYTTNQTIASGSAYSAAIGAGPYAAYGSFVQPTASFVYPGGTGTPFLLALGANEHVLINGTETYNNPTNCQFIAQSANVTLYGAPGAAVTAYMGGCTVCSYCGESGQRVLQQYVLVTNINGNTLGINPPLLWSYNPALAPTAQTALLTSNCGIEDLTVTRLNGTNTSGGANIDLSQTAWCWVTNVESYHAQGSHIRMTLSFQCQVSHCYLHDAYSYISGEGYGIWVYNHNSNHLIEDNIFMDIRHSMVTEAGGAACVFAYNFSTNPIAGEDPTTFLSGDELQHGAHAWYILYEGNVSVAARGDYTHGSSSHITYLRDNYYGTSYCGPQVHDAFNYLHTTNFNGSWVTNEGGFYAFDFEEYSHSNSVIGCVVSPSLLTNPIARPPLFTAYTNTYTDMNPMILRAGFLSMGSIGYLSDPTVAPSIYYHGNWDPITQGVVWNPSNPDHTIPNSLYLSNAPAWWPANLAWPLIGPDLSPMVGALPACTRLAGILAHAPPGAPSFLRIAP